MHEAFINIEMAGNDDSLRHLSNIEENFDKNTISRPSLNI